MVVHTSNKKLKIYRVFGTKTLKAHHLDTVEHFDTGDREDFWRYRYWRRMKTNCDSPRKLLVVPLHPPKHNRKRAQTKSGVVGNPGMFTDRAGRIMTTTETRYVRQGEIRGFGFVGVLPLFAWKCPSSDALRDVINDRGYDEAVGALSDHFTIAAVDWADEIVFAYGMPPLNRVMARLVSKRAVEVYGVCAAFQKLPKAFALTQEGWPAEPLLIKFGLPLEPWKPQYKEPLFPREHKHISIFKGFY